VRKHFSELLHAEMARDGDIVVLTGDLGYGLWDKIRLDYPSRFYNIGSAEQLMTGMAIGAAMEGKIPVVYSITSFLLYRPFELIRNYIDHEKIPVKLVGSGRDRDYGYLGFSHWAEDDTKFLSQFKNIDKYHPDTREDLEKTFDFFIHGGHPAYMNLKRKY